jgi:phage-related protein
MFELRHVGKLNTRVLWCFMKNRRIVLLHAIRNKGRSIPARDLDTARERMRDWRRRIES